MSSNQRHTCSSAREKKRRGGKFPLANQMGRRIPEHRAKGAPSYASLPSHLPPGRSRLPCAPPLIRCGTPLAERVLRVPSAQRHRREAGGGTHSGPEVRGPACLMLPPPLRAPWLAIAPWLATTPSSQGGLELAQWRGVPLAREEGVRRRG